MKHFYSQYDPRWSKIRIGEASFTLGEKGCAVTALCEKLGDFGIEITPDVLAKNPSLFTDKNHEKGAGLIIWDRVAAWLKTQHPNLSFSFKRYFGCGHVLIQQNLKPGHGVLLQVANESHWISADRKMLFRTDYNCRDPWGGKVCAAFGDYQSITGVLIIDIA